MIVCPRCGSSAGAEAAHCGVCGAALTGAQKLGASSDRPAPAGAMKKTMAGVAPNDLSPRQKALQNKRTMLGLPILAPPAPAPAENPAVAPTVSKRTMIGLQSPVPGAP